MNNAGGLRHSSDSGSDDGFPRPDLFNPTSLTNEEAELLKRIRFESTWRRGYPWAFAAGTLTAILTRRFSTPSRVALTAVSAIIGNVSGRISYLPEMQKRILSDLPPESPLRQKVVKLRQKGPAAFMEEYQKQMVESKLSPENDHFDSGSFFDHENKESSPKVDKKEESAPKKYISYAELREQNRKRQGQEFGNYRRDPVPPQNTDVNEDLALNELPKDDVEQPPSKVRYNKYGDRIIE